MQEAALRLRPYDIRLYCSFLVGLPGETAADVAATVALHGELDGRARRRMREAISELREKGKPEEKLRKLSEEVERLSGESTRLRERLEGLEGKSKSSSPTTPPASEPSPGAAAPPRTKRPRPGSRRSGKPLDPRRRR